MSHPIIIRHLGLVEYLPTYTAMQAFNNQRDTDTADELWVLQHPPVYTLGMAAKPEHLLNTAEIPVQQIDRGGQVTYHAPGQLIIYVLVDLKRLGCGVKRLVNHIEQAIIDYLAQQKIIAQRREKAPGVYVAAQKIAALGLRVRRNCSYHGLSLNVDMDLSPFQGINPCGYPGLAVTQLRDCGGETNISTVATQLSHILATQLGYAIEQQVILTTGEN